VFHPIAFSLVDGQPEWSEVALVIGVAFLLAALVSTTVARVVRLVLSSIYGDAVSGAPRLVGRPVLVARTVTFLLAFAVTVLPLLDAIGERFDVGFDGRSMLHWAIASGLRIAVIVTMAWLVLRIVATSTARLELELARTTSTGMHDRLKRAETLGALVRNIAGSVIISVALLMILRELNVDIMPMLTGAGIAGVALGFGAQWLVRDLIAGFFVILEDQVRVGDSVVINGQGGSVEAINLRTIVLRDVEGAVHVFPNGGITTLANRSRDFAYYLIDLNVDFQEDTDRVVQILRETAAKLQSEEPYRDAILEPLEVLGVDGFKDGQVLIRSRLKTLPQRQFEVGRELRRRLRYALDQAGIDLPPAGLHTVLSTRKT
jgi:small-conductance mechanosensitive channel